MSHDDRRWYDDRATAHCEKHKRNLYGTFVCRDCDRANEPETLRDRFAMAAPLPPVSEASGDGQMGERALAAYRWADAMLAARQPPEREGESSAAPSPEAK